MEYHPFSDLAWDVTEPQYREDPALSYSTLSKYEREGRFRSIPSLREHISTPSLVFGSIVDALTTGGYGEFDSLFTVADMPELSENLEQIARELFAIYGDSLVFKDIPEANLAEVGKNCGYYAADKFEAYRVKLIKENCETYYNLLKASQGKTLISQKDYNDALACATKFRESPFTSWYFSDLPYADDERTNINYYQLKFKGVDKNTGVEYRNMADILKILPEEKLVIPCDVKTTSKPEEDFYKSFLTYNYNLQARLYWRLIRKAMDKDEYYKDFKLANYRFLVINRNTLTPLVWEDNMTQAVGEVRYQTKSGHLYTVRDPYVIGKELNDYRINQNEYPITVGPINNITEFIQES